MEVGGEEMFGLCRIWGGLDDFWAKDVVLGGDFDFSLRPNV